MSHSTLFLTTSLIALFTLAGCNGVTTQAACVPCDTNDCGGGTGGGSLFGTSGSSTSTGAGGEEEPNLCGCQLPATLPAGQAECTVARVEGGICGLTVALNGEHCRGGRGKCMDGNCMPVVWGAQCLPMKPSADTSLCGVDADCDDGNPCTHDYCPEPGCGRCAHIPATDLSPCGAAYGTMICREGACCDDPGAGH